MSAEKYLEQCQDDYAYLLCCNLETLIVAWEAYDGETDVVVNGRRVDERALVYAMQELGHEVSI